MRNLDIYVELSFKVVLSWSYLFVAMNTGSSYIRHKICMSTRPSMTWLVTCKSQYFNIIQPLSRSCLKKNQSTPRPSEHPPVMGGKMSKRLPGRWLLLSSH